MNYETNEYKRKILCNTEFHQNQKRLKSIPQANNPFIFQIPNQRN
jgi:hypothetical protein